MNKLAITEKRNKNTKNIDLMSSLEIVKTINKEDAKVIKAVKKESKNIARAIDEIVKIFNSGGRLFYFGAGTSGRLGVLDASECPPTFGVDSSMVQGFIAGGDSALRVAVEGAEDSLELGKEEAIKCCIGKNDVVVGISANGNARYVYGVISKAKENGAVVIGLTCNKESLIKEIADIYIAPIVGEEVITGSTRMKAGTSHKMVLNMLTTGSMIRIGKTYENLMVDVNASNEKLKDRAIRIVCEIANVEKEKAEKFLIKTDWKVKPTIVMIVKNIELEEANKSLDEVGGVLRKVI